MAAAAIYIYTMEVFMVKGHTTACLEVLNNIRVYMRVHVLKVMRFSGGGNIV